MITPSLICAGSKVSGRAFAWVRQAAPWRRSVAEFGAIGAAETVNTEAIQRAIDAVSKDGCLLDVAAGSYVVGMLLLKTGVTLHLAAGATLARQCSTPESPNHILRSSQVSGSANEFNLVDL